MANEDKKKEIELDLIVVPTLPQQPIRETVDNDGKKYGIITIDEALTEMLRILKEIKKSVA